MDGESRDDRSSENEREEAIKESKAEERFGEIVTLIIFLALFVSGLYIAGLVISYAS